MLIEHFVGEPGQVGWGESACQGEGAAVNVAEHVRHGPGGNFLCAQPLIEGEQRFDPVSKRKVTSVDLLVQVF